MSAHTSIIAESITYSIGAFGLAVGTIVALVAWRLDDQETVPYDDAGYAMLIAIPALAALAYVGMRFDTFAITTNGIQIQTLRYVDWAVTTPLLVGYMAYAAQADRRTVVGVIVADLLMVLLGFVAVLQTGVAVYVLGGLSTIAYFCLVYYLFGPLDRLVRDRGGADKWAVYAKLRNLVGFLWFAYPVVWVLSPPALQVLTRQTTGVLITYMDVAAKLGFVLIATNTAGVFDSLLTGDDDYDTELTTDGGRETGES
ncbi:bacteriorhodopsin [Halobaculum sp. MBLA0143]|uniref:bacteriorhodopsin n=1 Tax=Halobaculum sp. MBLA0143 TaxID=3079933 RepID=UPI003524E1D5